MLHTSSLDKTVGKYTSPRAWRRLDRQAVANERNYHADSCVWRGQNHKGPAGIALVRASGFLANEGRAAETPRDGTELRSRREGTSIDENPHGSGEDWGTWLLNPEVLMPRLWELKRASRCPDQTLAETGVECRVDIRVSPESDAIGA